MENAFELWINIKITDPELAEKLDKMVAEDESDRSKFIRRLIRQEIGRRQQMSFADVPAKKTSGRRMAVTA